MLAWLFEAWKAYAHRAATYQTRVLLSVVYGVILGPAGLIARRFGAQLLDLRIGSDSTWVNRADQEKTLGALRRQF